jgi:hypothetical protein
MSNNRIPLRINKVSFSIIIRQLLIGIILRTDIVYLTESLLVILVLSPVFLTVDLTLPSNSTSLISIQTSIKPSVWKASMSWTSMTHHERGENR